MKSKVMNYIHPPDKSFFKWLYSPLPFEKLFQREAKLKADIAKISAINKKDIGKPDTRGCIEAMRKAKKMKPL